MASSQQLKLAGRYLEAIPLVQEALRKDKFAPDESGASEDVVVTLMGARKFAAAAKQLNGIIERHPRRSCMHYVYRGLIHWYRGEPAEALSHWRAGLKCHYAYHDLLEVPFMMYFAVAKQPGIVDDNEIITLINARVNRKFVQRELWPYPIASFLFGEIEAEELVERAVASDGRFPARITALQVGEAHFYVALSKLKQGDATAYYAELEQAAAIGRKAINNYFFELLITHLELGSRRPTRGKRSAPK
jgi:lipoprotein NlpI